jgi:hypothetical protein
LRRAEGKIRLYVICLIVLAFTPLAFSQIHSTVDTLKVNGTSAAPGEYIYAGINLANTFNVGGFSFRITYDTLKLAFIDSTRMTIRSLMMTVYGTDTTRHGVVRFVAASFNPVQDYIQPGWGAVTILRFLVRQNASEGPTNIAFVDSLLGDNSLSNDSGSLLVFPVLVNGSLSILAPAGIDDQAQVPDNIWLSNYPNPFNSSTKIMFSLSKEDNVTINIFDVLGRKVRALNLGDLSAGIHSVSWNGLDDSEREVSTGVYCYLLYANNDPIMSKRMILLR